MTRRRIHLLTFIAASIFVTACGGGVPIRIIIDEFAMELSLDELIDQAFGELKGQGLFPATAQAMPVLWPTSLPDISYKTIFASPPVPVDLTPDPGSADADKYEMINKAEAAVTRIEMNRLILRIDASTLSIPLPELRFQIADSATADPNDRLAWETVGIIPSAAARFVGDIEFEFVPGGESYFNAQFMDDEKELALRVLGKIDFDTSVQRELPSGRALTRFIIVATFFVDPMGAASLAGELGGQAQ